MNPKSYPLSDTTEPLQVENPFEVMQPGERVICEIRRHPIGLFGVYTLTGLILALALSVIILVPMYATFLTSQQRLGTMLAALLVIVVDVIFTYIGVYIYRANRWVVSTDSITQITQIGLFTRHISQLSLANLEDVSADQDGIVQQLLGYGDLLVETAGERSKFVFAFCPNPNEYARKIIAAHEEYIAARPKDVMTSNRPLANVQSLNQPPSQ